MKKIFLIPLAVLLLFSMTACNLLPEITGPLERPPEPEASVERELSAEPVHEHTWVEADYWTPKTCTECGETEGDPLPPNFETLGLTVSEMDVPHRYASVTYNDYSIPTVGEVTATDYKIIESDETHEAKEGYEWRIVTLKYHFFDENAASDGWRTSVIYDDNYYAFDLETTVGFSEGENENDGEEEAKRTVNFMGEGFEIEEKDETVRNEWVGQEAYFEKVYSFQVPIGYDGMMITCYNPANKLSALNDGNETALEKDLIDENTVYFRLD